MNKYTLQTRHAILCASSLLVVSLLMWGSIATYLASPLAVTGWNGLVMGGIITAWMGALFVILDRFWKLTASRLLDRNWEMAGEKVELAESLERLEESYIALLENISRAVEANDAYACGHAKRVATYSLRIGRALGLSETELATLERSALFHDIGRVLISDHLTSKVQPLSAMDRSAIRMHPVVGSEMLEGVPALKNEALAVLHHHERYDGSGYPYGLKGAAIPLESRILAVVDTFDAMTSDRPWRDAMGMQEALEEIYASAGSQFDPKVVDAFLDVLDDISLQSEPTILPRKGFGARLYSMVGNC